MPEYAHKKSRWYRTGLPYLLTAVAPLCWGGYIVLARDVADIIPVFRRHESGKLLAIANKFYYKGGIVHVYLERIFRRQWIQLSGRTS